MSRAPEQKRLLSSVSAAFLENRDFLKKFLRRYFSRQQDIEDVVQETYLRAYAVERKKEVEHPKAFLFRIAKNIALTELSKKSRQITDYLEESEVLSVVASEPSTQEEVEAQETLARYCEAVANLPEKCREVYLLRKVHGLPHKEIAERMSLSISSVAKYLARGILICDAFARESGAREIGDSRQRTQ